MQVGPTHEKRHHGKAGENTESAGIGVVGPSRDEPNMCSWGVCRRLQIL